MNREDLFDKYLQRSLTREEAEELKALLKSDPTAGRALVEHINEAGLMVRVGSQMQSMAPAGAEILELPRAEGMSQGAARGPAAGVESRPTRRRRHLVALAACLTVLAAAAWMFFPAAAPLRATVASVAGDASIVRGTRVMPAEVGMHLKTGDVVRTGPQSKATIVFDGEATRAEVNGGGEATFSTAQGSKRIDVADGAVEATVAPQPAGRPLILATLHAEARVRGTRLLVASEVSSTRLEVTEGAVEFVRRSDGQTILVRNGYSAVASPNTEFCTRPFLPAPWRSQDIGAVRLRGQTRFDGTTFRLRGSGQDTCCQKDQLHFVYQPLDGDGEIRARVREIEFADPESRACLTFRKSLKSSSPQISLGVTASGGLEIEHRAKTESHLERAGWAAAPCWLRLQRQGDFVTAYQSGDGTNWVKVGEQPFSLPGRVWVGLTVTSFNHAALSTAVFEQVNVHPIVAAAANR
jgi:ferric-dicitrate binding protein FerR (iron transport regulator)